MNFLKIALRELRRSWRFGLFFIFNLSLGLTGFVSLEAFKQAIQSSIDANARAVLSADIAVSARRQITEAEHQAIRAILGSAPETLTYDFFAMLSSDKGSRLVSVRAVDAAYPFYGRLELASGRIITAESPKSILGSETAWVYPELESQTGLGTGDFFKLGQLRLKITDTVVKDGTQTFRAASLAPRVFIDRAWLPRSGLIQFGSTFSMSYLYKLPAKADAEKMRRLLYSVLRDPSIQIDTPTTAGEDSGRQLAYLSDYLGLVSIIALFMSILGASYIYRLYLSQKLKDIAILRSLGLQSREAVGIYVFQVLVLGALASVPTLIGSSLVLPFLNYLLARLTPFPLHPVLSARVFAISLGTSVLGSFLVSFPFIRRLRELRPAQLFSEDGFSQEVSARRVWLFLPAVLVFWGLAIYQAHSWTTGSAFMLSLAAVLAVLALLAWSGSLLLLRWPAHRWYLRYSLLGLRRRKAASFAIFIAVGLGALLMNILPQLKTTLQAEFQVGGGSKLPSLFMFDIQDEEVGPLRDFLKEQGLVPTMLSPLVRARILTVNGASYERSPEDKEFRTREEEREARFRNRGVNLSYRAQLSPSETIVHGKPFSGSYDPQKQKEAELSVEAKYAERVGLHLGDHLVFDVQGVEVPGRVINLRQVKWTSFQPNFFILMQDGVLNEAPKTFIAALPAMPEAQKSRLQNELAARFPNVSILDIARVVQDVLGMAEQMSWSLELMATLALLTGYIVLFSILRTQLRGRRWELNMLKILGARRRQVLAFVLSESFAVVFLSSLAGAGLSFVVSGALSYFIFEAEFKIDLFWPLISVISITGASLLVAVLAALDVVREKPLQILRSEG